MGRRATGLLLSAALLLALLDGLICARAALGRTGSWAFPIDDAYIYTNYARALVAGHPFAYNYPTTPDELSGGVTGMGWMLLVAGAYPLTAVAGAAPAGLAPQVVQAQDPALALEAGRWYLAAYGLGALLLAAAAVVAAWLAALLYAGGGAPGSRIVAVAAGVALLADPPILFASYSGLELPLSLLLVALAPATLLADLRRAPDGRGLRASLVAAALLPWARPELVVIAGAATLWLAGGALRGRLPWRAALTYGGAVAAGALVLSAVYLGATGRPLPSSFYAKVDGVAAAHVFDALREWAAAGTWGLALLLGAATAGAAALWIVGRRGRASDAAWPGHPAALVAACAGAYFGAMLLTLRWFGQEDRYILPIVSLAWPLAGGLVAVGIARAPVAGALRRLGAWPGHWALGGAAALAALVVAVVGLRVWAAAEYATFVQNIEDAHVAPARWIATHAAPGAVVAAEPIGAIRLFSAHPTVDLVGLTTPAQLGHYADWAATAALLQARGVGWLLYYPAWWPDGRAAAWAQTAQVFPVPDNLIAGADPIAVYRVDFTTAR